MYEVTWILPRVNNYCYGCTKNVNRLLFIFLQLSLLSIAYRRLFLYIFTCIGQSRDLGGNIRTLFGGGT